jgi:hypothetical protein
VVELKDDPLAVTPDIAEPPQNLPEQIAKLTDAAEERYVCTLRGHDFSKVGILERFF